MTEGAIPHLMILDNLQDPGNLGTIFRTAEAAGVTGIYNEAGIAWIFTTQRRSAPPWEHFTGCRFCMWMI